MARPKLSSGGAIRPAFGLIVSANATSPVCVGPYPAGVAPELDGPIALIGFIGFMPGGICAVDAKRCCGLVAARGCGRIACGKVGGAWSGLRSSRAVPTIVSS